MALTIASRTSGRLPSLKFGTHSTSRFISTPDELSTLESRNTEVYRGEIGNFPIIRDVIHRKVRLLARLDRSHATLAPNGAGSIYRSSRYRFRRRHFHLSARQRENELHVQSRGRAGIEVGCEGDSGAGVDELASGSVTRRTSIEQCGGKKRCNHI